MNHSEKIAITGIVAGVALGLLISTFGQVSAHTPCNDVYRQPQCEYVQVVNPLTGKLETQYICN